MLVQACFQRPTVPCSIVFPFNVFACLDCVFGPLSNWSWLTQTKVSVQSQRRPIGYIKSVPRTLSGPSVSTNLEKQAPTCGSTKVSTFQSGDKVETTFQDISTVYHTNLDDKTDEANAKPSSKEITNALPFWKTKGRRRRLIFSV